MKAKGNKDKKSLTQKNNILPIVSFVSDVFNAKNEIENTEKKIQKGISKPTASTGTPIDKLNGAAKFMAVLSNIGGGSVNSGGGGVKEGFNTITKNVSAKSTLKAMKKFDIKKIVKR